jgi:galactonate dehydratase
VRAKSPVPIASGERVYNLYEMREYLEKRAMDYIQPDITHAGGVMALKKMAAMAESYYVAFAPHNPGGPVAAAATLQLAACVPNFEILEIMVKSAPWRKDMTDESLDFADGCILIPQKPGIGIEINEEAIAKYPPAPHINRQYGGGVPLTADDAVYYFNNI